MAVVYASSIILSITFLCVLKGDPPSSFHGQKAGRTYPIRAFLPNRIFLDKLENGLSQLGVS